MAQDTRWYPYENGTTIGADGTEEGVIIEDDEHTAGARITLEDRNGKPARYAITCGLYGWFFHTRFFASEAEARHDFTEMKLELGRMADRQSADDVGEEQLRHEVLDAISDFVDRFPT